MSLRRIVYRSENAMRMPAQRMLIHYNDIVSTARRMNPRFGICGFLMFDRFRFHQVIEGPENAIRTLYGCIQRDVRHENIETIGSERISSPFFTDWSMASFLSEDASHPVQIKHGIGVNVPLSAETFLRFAMEFVSVESADA